MKLITALFASTLILTMASYRQADVPGTREDTLPDSLASSRQYREWIRKDTIPKPQYEYVYKTTIPINQLQPTLDTINMIMENFGIDMLVSRSKALKELFNQKMGVLFRGLVVDSIKIRGGVK